MMAKTQNLEEQIKAFINTKSSTSTKNTLYSYASDCRIFVDWYTKNKEKYSQGHIYSAFVNELMAQPLSPNTKKRRKTTVGEFLIFLKIYPEDYIVVKGNNKVWYFSKDKYTILTK